VLLGYRQLNFLSVTGFEALTGPEDLRRGVQIGATLGRSLGVGDTPASETYAALSFYAGGGSPTMFAAGEISGEARHGGRTGQWDDLLVGGRLAGYLRPHDRHTVTASLEYSAGHRQRRPFQLALGDRRGGVRGYERAQLGGGERVVLRLEERWRIGNIRGTADAGVAFFTDVGWLGAGDAPLGETTGAKPSVGISLLGALPPRSRRLWRLDLAFPLDRGAGARWGVRVTNEDRTRSFWIAPNDIRRNRDMSVPLSAFTWR
jgi:hypothetical protein